MDRNIDKNRMPEPPATEIKEEITSPRTSRRAVLRGALAVGCGLWVPIVFSGCNSKKDTGSPAASSSTTPSSPATPATSTAPAAAKAKQASVQYQTQPKGDQKCSLCRNFIAETKTCKVVEGSISPDGWCTLWTKMG